MTGVRSQGFHLRLPSFSPRGLSVSQARNASNFQVWQYFCLIIRAMTLVTYACMQSRIARALIDITGRYKKCTVQINLFAKEKRSISLRAGTGQILRRFFSSRDGQQQLNIWGIINKFAT